MVRVARDGLAKPFCVIHDKDNLEASAFQAKLQPGLRGHRRRTATQDVPKKVEIPARTASRRFL